MSIPLTNMGEMYRKQGMHEQALTCYCECIAICRAIGDQFIRAYALSGEATSRFELQAYEKAVRANREASQIAEETENPVVGFETALLECHLGAACASANQGCGE